MIFPAPVQTILARLGAAGFSAYAVGGCVRDTLLKKKPKDWDICTSALPDQIEAVFSGEHLVETGLRHGTVSVVLNHILYEVTTYRVDGAYTDHRHPDTVSFVDRIDQDLARRDFTINAMAFDAAGRLLDLHRGEADLAAGIIRCVGEPSQRFQEDALRILRALRFASELNFDLDPATDNALRQLYPTLERVAPERIRTELLKLLCGPAAGKILRTYPEIITFLLPCLQPAVEYEQHNPHHLYTVWEHTVRAVENIQPDPLLRFTMLLHDAGKPYTRTTDANGIGHYIGHQAASARLASEMLKKYRFDRVSADRITRLVEAHDIPLSTEPRVLRRRLNQFGEEDLRALFEIHMADRIATGTRNPEHAREHRKELNVALDTLLAQRPCYSLKDLQVRGTDLLALGFRGKDVGERLQFLLDQVIEGTLPNEKAALLHALETDPSLSTKDTPS